MTSRLAMRSSSLPMAALLLIVLQVATHQGHAFQPVPRGPRSTSRPSFPTTSTMHLRQRMSNSNFKSLLSATKIEKTEEEWKQQLSPEAYYVLREAGTERPNSSELNRVKDEGTFTCRGCGAPLFRTSSKFDSGTGWPSFYQPLPQATNLKMDFSLLLPRTEVTCATCDGHLGHVFEDGPEPTGQRYCMNGISMEFASDEANPALATQVRELQQSTPYKPSAGSQIPSILFNGGIGILFFTSFVNRIGDMEVMGLTPGWFDFLPTIPAVFYGVLAARGIMRLIQ